MKISSNKQIPKIYYNSVVWCLSSYFMAHLSMQQLALFWGFCFGKWKRKPVSVSEPDPFPHPRRVIHGENRNGNWFPFHCFPESQSSRVCLWSIVVNITSTLRLCLNNTNFPHIKYRWWTFPSLLAVLIAMKNSSSARRHLIRKDHVITVY